MSQDPFDFESVMLRGSFHGAKDLRGPTMLRKPDGIEFDGGASIGYMSVQDVWELNEVFCKAPEPDDDAKPHQIRCSCDTPMMPAINPNFHQERGNAYTC